jgi:hypothetical protein
MGDMKDEKFRTGSEQTGLLDGYGLSAKSVEPTGEWELLVPETKAFAESVSTKARSSSLKGKTILLRRNDKPNSDILLERIGTLFTEKIEDIRIIKAWETVPGSDMAKPGADILKKISALRPDLVISAHGD